VLGGLAVALACARRRIVRQFVIALAPGAIVVPALFLLDPTVRQNFALSEIRAAVPTIERKPPIVFVIFDELSLNSLLDAEGNIDAVRYPNFAALARDAHWFRNATTVSEATAYSVPAILSGRYPIAANAAPTLQYYPVNLFTALARHYAITAQLKFQSLCPPSACQNSGPASGDSVAALLSDLGVVWLHVVLPDSLTESLPPLADDWSDFTAHRMQGVEGRSGVFARFLSWIDDRPDRLYFLHSMLPHTVLEYVPSGRQYSAPTRALEPRRAPFQRASAAFADMFHQRYLAQVGMVDGLLGDLIARLHQVGIYDKALVVITADHGVSYREGESRRSPQQRNLSDILEVPLLIKFPDQHGGKVVDRPAETVDILPTLLDAVGAKAPLHMEGQSLVAADVAARTSRTYIVRDQVNAERRTVGDLSMARAESLARKERRFGRGDVTGLYAPPGDRHLLGMDVAKVPSVPGVQITIRNRSQYAVVDRERYLLPLFVQGGLATSRSAPLLVAIAINGVVAAVTRSYRDGGAHMFGTLVPETSLHNGANAVTAVVVDESSSVYPGT
jgi:hypothetical protein